VIPLLRRAIGNAELTRASQVRQIITEIIDFEEPIAAILVMATADGRMIANHIGVAPTLKAAMRDELQYAARRLHDDLVEHQRATVHQLHAPSK